MKIQSHSFDAPKQESGVVSKVATGFLTVALFSSGAFAADPTWLTEVTTELSAIPTMIAGIITTGVAIYMAPIAWAKIKHAIGRA